MTDPTTAAGQKCPLCGHEPVTVTPQKYGFPKVEARQQDASALREALEGLDEPWQWLNDNYPKALREMPTHVYRRFEKARAALPPSASAGLDVERLRIAYEAGRLAADFEETLARINATMTADTTEIAANLARLEQDHP